MQPNAYLYKKSTVLRYILNETIIAEYGDIDFCDCQPKTKMGHVSYGS